MAETLDRYQQAGEFGDRLRALEQQLVTDRWLQIDNPAITYRGVTGAVPGPIADE